MSSHLASTALGLGVLAIGAGTHQAAPVVPAAVAGQAAAPYIIEGRTLEAARDAVGRVGAKTTGDLAIINAVTASLTAAQKAAISSQAGVVSVSDDVGVQTTAAASVMDRFEAPNSLTNNDGTHRWLQGWVGSPVGGTFRFGEYNRGGNRFVIAGPGTVDRYASIPGSSPTLTLRFSALRAGLEAGDYVSVQMSRDSGFTYSEVARIAGPASESKFRSYSIDVSGYRAKWVRLRFVSNLSAVAGADSVVLDDVQLAYSTTYGAADPIPLSIGAEQVHAAGYRGQGVGVAIIDTGFWDIDGLQLDSNGQRRMAAQYDASRDQVDCINCAVSTDGSGHGTHLSSIIANSRRAADGRFFGIAPDVRLITIKAFDDSGASTYSTVIRGIDWAVANRSTHNIRVLNLSLGAPARSRYWDDPLNKAVMRAWQAGIVVVVSAGNSGPAPQTVTVPGNVPYVLTVGAMTDAYSTTDLTDDRLASFSSTGPTYEGFVKPDVVAPGGHVWGYMALYMNIAYDHSTYQNSGPYFTMSGTSQAAAVTSGVAALILSGNPALTPDEVKCKIMAGARPAVTTDGQLAYSVLQQGAGLVNAYQAFYEPTTNCANRGLDLAADIAGTRHFVGSVTQQADGKYRVTSPDGSLLDQGYLWDQGYIWNEGYVWNDGYLWEQGYLWNQGYLWTQDKTWVTGFPQAIGADVSSTAAMSINHWVAQE